MTVLDEIQEARVKWIGGNNREPDTILIPNNKYEELVREVRKMVIFPDMNKGTLKFMGMEIICSYDVSNIKVGRMNP